MTSAPSALESAAPGHGPDTIADSSASNGGGCAAGGRAEAVHTAAEVIGFLYILYKFGLARICQNREVAVAQSPSPSSSECGFLLQNAQFRGHSQVILKCGG